MVAALFMTSWVSEGGQVAKEDRGFASMDRGKQKEIASKGGKAAHAKGRAHEWTVDEARAAGRKGGSASHKNESPPPQRGWHHDRQTQTTAELLHEQAGAERPFSVLLLRPWDREQQRSVADGGGVSRSQESQPKPHAAVRGLESEGRERGRFHFRAIAHRL